MKFRRIAAVAAASAMSLSVMAANASAAEYDAFLMFTDINWAWGNWNAGVAGDTVVNGYGTYTVTLDNTQAENATAPATGANVFCVDIIGGGAEFSVDNTVATIDSIKCDGNEVAVDNSKIAFGDIEENGNFRIEIRNAYGSTGDMASPNYNPIDADNFTVSEKIEVTFTLSDPNGGAASADTEAAETEAAAPAADSTTDSSNTGNTSAAALAGVMAVAAAAAFAVKKSK